MHDRGSRIRRRACTSTRHSGSCGANRTRGATPVKKSQLLHDLGSTLFSIKGHGDEDAARAFARMRELAEHLDDAALRLRAMDGLLLVHTMRAEYAIARQRGEEMLLLAEEVGNRMAVARALPSLGATLLHLGEVEAAAEIGERGRALGGPREPTLHAIACCSVIACSSALRGLVDHARAMNRESVGLARQGSIPYLRASAATFAASVSKIMHDVASTRSLAEEAVRIASDLEFSVIGSIATIYRAWCDIQDGRIDEGVEALRSSPSTPTWRRASASAPRPTPCRSSRATSPRATCVARASCSTGRWPSWPRPASASSSREIHRLKGECLLAGPTTRSQRADAIDCFRERAIGLAADQHALLFELRAATSLYRMRPKRPASNSCASPDASPRRTTAPICAPLGRCSGPEVARSRQFSRTLMVFSGLLPACRAIDSPRASTPPAHWHRRERAVEMLSPTVGPLLALVLALALMPAAPRRRSRPSAWRPRPPAWPRRRRGCSSARRSPRRPASQWIPTPRTASPRSGPSSTAAARPPRAASRSSRARPRTTASRSTTPERPRAAVDACVASLVAAIDPPPPDQTKCGAGKKKCVAKYLAGAAEMSHAGPDAEEADRPEYEGLRRQGGGEVHRRRRSHQGLLREARGEGPERLSARERLGCPAGAGRELRQRVRRRRHRDAEHHLHHARHDDQHDRRDDDHDAGQAPRPRRRAPRVPRPCDAGPAAALEGRRATAPACRTSSRCRRARPVDRAKRRLRIWVRQHDVSRRHQRSLLQLRP